MDRAATIAQLKATQATLTAAYAQIEAQIVALEAEGAQEDAGEPICTECGGRKLAPAGDVWVCPCGANIPRGDHG